MELADKLQVAQELGFGYIQFHDDDVVPNLGYISQGEIRQQAQAMRTLLDSLGLQTEFVAPRLWEAPVYHDGAYTASSSGVRQLADDRSRMAIDIAKIMGTDLIVLWLAREGTTIHESKDPVRSITLLAEAIDKMLQYDPTIRIAVEPKPNEPVGQSFIPTAGHALALGSMTADPKRVGINIESAHAILAGLDPALEMATGLAVGRLMSVHLNDQDGMKFDQDLSFGAVNLRRALRQVMILDQYGYHGVVGLDVKALRTQSERRDHRISHLKNSMAVFNRLLEISRSLDPQTMAGFMNQGDYEGLGAYINKQLIGVN